MEAMVIPLLISRTRRWQGRLECNNASREDCKVALRDALLEPDAQV